ncbi:unnamed protein product [Ixodes persulcatus]
MWTESILVTLRVENASYTRRERMSTGHISLMPLLLSVKLRHIHRSKNIKDPTTNGIRKNAVPKVPPDRKFVKARLRLSRSPDAPSCNTTHVAGSQPEGSRKG